MENLKEISDVMERVSMASIKYPEKDVSKLKKEQPQDAFYLVHLLCLLFGLLNWMPLTFFITANDYWMYKFRDPEKDSVDLNNKTTLETYFTSGSMVVQTVPSMVTMLLATTYGNRFKVRSRFIFTLILTSVIFIVFTALIKVNTDTWQVAFFVITLLGMSIITGNMNLFQVTSMTMVTKFPPIYMKTFLFGQGMAPIFNASLQIISLALGTSTETSALFYFVAGTSLVTGSLIFYLFVQRSTFYQHHMEVELDDSKQKFSIKETKAVFFQMWPLLSVFVLILLSIFTTHPALTSLVVSENYGNGNAWNDVYFVPTITYLFGEVWSQLGRLLAKPIFTKSNGPWLLGLMLIRFGINLPLVMLCNAQPRKNFPVLLPHDWEYFLVLIFYFFINGYMLSAGTLSVPNLVEKEYEDAAYMLLMANLGVMGGALSPLSLLIVRLI